MDRVWFGALGLVMLMSFTACDGGDPSQTPPPEEQDQRIAYSLTPSVVGRGLPVTVQLDATRSVFVFGDTSLDLGPDILVESVTVKDGFTAEADLLIDPNAELGPRDAVISTGQLEATLPEALTLIDESFTVSPSDGKMGELVTVNLEGLGTTWEDGYTWASFGPGVQVLDLTVQSPTQAQARIAIRPDAPPGARDVSMEDGPHVVTAYRGFTVDRAVITAFWEPPEAYQGASVGFTITGLDTAFANDTQVEFWDDGGRNADIEVTQLTWIDEANLSGRIRLSNAARLGYRDVVLTTGDESLLIPEAIRVLDAPPDLSNLYPGIGFDVTRTVNNADGSISESVSAYAYFVIPLSPPCGSGSPMGAGPMPYDQNGVFPVPPEPEPADCPNPETVSVGDQVWFEGPENVVTLPKDAIGATGQILYRGVDLTLDDYHFNQLYDLHAPGDPVSGVPEFLVEQVQPTVPADFEVLEPQLWGDFTWSRAQALPLAWTPAQTYPSAIFSISIGGLLAQSGEPGFAGVLPWDDGQHAFQPAELAGLQATSVSFTAVSAIEGPYFGLPFSTVQIAKANSSLSVSGQMILE